MRYPAESEDGSAGTNGREAVSPTSRPTPLALVSDAVAGGDLRGVAETVAHALRCTVAVAIPGLGEVAVVPAGSVAAETVTAIEAFAERAVAMGDATETAPAEVTEAVAVRIADQVVGIVAAIAGSGDGDGDGPEDRRPTAGAPSRDRRAWLEAAAAAASVTARLEEAHGRPAPLRTGEEILAELSGGEPADLAGTLTRARRAGVDLRSGAIALAARLPAAGTTPHGPGAGASLVAHLPAGSPILCAQPATGRLHGLVPLTAPGSAAAVIADRLASEGWIVALSAARRDPAQLRQALLEAELLSELHASDALAPGQEDTYRLLIGVLLRDPEELELLRAQTITSLAEYDARHDTELLATLRAFLLHDGSTTETAEAMRLHRHTVGYRLSRVHEVSGLSPYESAGRERLSLGLKAEQIISSARRSTQSQLAL
jgi:PucR-like helix-turn-helix protein